MSPDRKSIADKLKSIYDGKELATVGLERLTRNSSTLARAMQICNTVPDHKSREMVAQVFLNCYCGGFVAGIDFCTKEQP
jgi:hypothetical protein